MMRILPFMLTQTVSLHIYLGTNAYGESSYAAPVQIKCRFEFQSSTQKQPQKEENRFTARLFTLYQNIPSNSKVEFENETYFVTEVIKHYGFMYGFSHTEVALT